MLSTELLQLLHALQHGTHPSAVQITYFSDLSREDAAELVDHWHRITSDLRQEIIERATALAEDNVDLDFTELAHVALGDEVPEIRELAVDCVWESHDRETARLLRGLLNDEQESVRAAAATGLAPFALASELGELDPAEGSDVTEALRTLAQREGESVDVRARAIESLGCLSLPWVAGVITDAYYADDERLRMAAVRAMGLSATEDWLEYLEETALSEDPALRYETALSLGAIGSEAGIEMLGDMLTDEDAEVLGAAVIALGQIGGEDAENHLLGLLHSVDEEDEVFREAIEDALEAARYADGREPDLLRTRIGL